MSGVYRGLQGSTGTDFSTAVEGAWPRGFGLVGVTASEYLIKMRRNPKITVLKRDPLALFTFCFSVILGWDGLPIDLWHLMVG